MFHHCHSDACQLSNDIRVVVSYIHHEVRSKVRCSVGPPGVVMIERVALALLRIGNQTVYISRLVVSLTFIATRFLGLCAWHLIANRLAGRSRHAR